jgi:hypothetical protein
METIENKLIESIKNETERFENDPKVKEFEKAYSEFKTLVIEGIVKERGYNLLSIETSHLNGVNFNAPTN